MARLSIKLQSCHVEGFRISELYKILGVPFPITSELVKNRKNRVAQGFEMIYIRLKLAKGKILMKTTSLFQASDDYDRIEKAIKFIEKNLSSQPDLKNIADHIGLSEFHFQRLFSRWVGISPKRFLQFLTKEYAKQLLQQSANLLDVTYEAGLSSPGRLHDLFVT